MQGGGVMEPVISVIIPARDEERHLGEAIASISSQSFAGLEIIVVNNGSTDGTAEIISQWAIRDRRIRVLTLDRPSLHHSLRRAVAMSRAPFIARIDADDVAAQTRLEKQFEKMVADSALGVLGTAAELIDSAGRVIGFTEPPLTNHSIKAYLPTGCPFVHSSVMMRRSAYEKAGAYRKGLNLSEDYDLWLRMAAVTEMANLSDRLVQYRQRRGSVSARRGTRLAISSLCVEAAGKARLAGLPEPIVNGTPMLRKALPLLGKSRMDVRARIYREAFERRFLAFPVPFAFKRRLRKAAVRCGLKPIFGWLLSAAAASLAVNKHHAPVERP